MNKRIVYKYVINPRDGVAIMPLDCKILKIGFQSHDLWIWAEVPFEAGEDAVYTFKIVPTGEVFEEPEEQLTFIDTVFHPAGLVFHVYQYNYEKDS